MKQITKTLITCTLLFFTKGTQAFTTNTFVIAENPKLNIEKQGNQVHVTYEYELKNTSEKITTYQIIYPQISGTNNSKLFLNLDGIETVEKSGKNKIDTLWDISQQNINPFFLRWGKNEFPSILISNPIPIEGNGIQNIKYEYTFNTKTIQNWQWIQGLFPISEQPTQITLSFPKDEWILSNINAIKHLAPFEHEDQKFIEATTQLSSDIVLGWSNNPSPIKQGYIGHTYQIIPTKPELFQPEKVTLLLDTSGSITMQQWMKTSETVRFFLNEILQGKQIQIGLFNEDITWLALDSNQTPNYQNNDVELRQSIFETIDTTRPLGKTNLTQILQDEILLDHLSEEQGLILITDETYTDQKLPPHTAILHVGNKTERASWTNQITESSSWIFGLLSAQTALLESKDLKNMWNTWYKPNHTLSGLQDNHSLPNQTHTTVPNINIGRTFEPTHKEEWFQWIPQQWAKNQMEWLENKKEQTQEDRDAIASIKTVFGLNPNPLFVNQDPSYEIDGTWEVYNFSQQQNPNTTIDIAPFSTAAQYLYKNYPNLVADGMSAGILSNFCTQKRCIRITKDGDKDVSPFIRAYWNEKDPNHWALPYVHPMVKSGEYPIKENGDLELEQPISRGDFIQMMYNRIPTYRWRKGVPLTFEDLPENNPYFEAISWFSEHKIITGYPDKTVQPNRPLSRAEAVKIMLSTDGYKPNEEEDPVFNDSTTWEKPWVNEAQRREYVRGFSQTQFKPHSPLTKGQAAKIITKFFE